MVFGSSKHFPPIHSCKVINSVNSPPLNGFVLEEARMEDTVTEKSTATKEGTTKSPARRKKNLFERCKIFFKDNG